MDAVTYPAEKVASFLSDNVIPLRVAHDHPTLAQQFSVKWTPTLITLDPDGQERHRTVGFLGPDELIPSVLLGMGKCFFENDRFAEALSYFEKLLATCPKSDSAPEAIFLRGVSLYKSTKNPKPLREAYDKLVGEYPQSEWARRADPYRLIT
jgi:tetratricopeptide (TPR) repeat protein